MVPQTPNGREDGGAFLMAGIDWLEEKVGAPQFDRKVANLIDDEQGDPFDEAWAVMASLVKVHSEDNLDDRPSFQAKAAYPAGARADASCDASFAITPAA